MHIELWGDTDRGQRPDNQDAIYFARPGKQDVTQEQINQHGYLLAVADGVAGNLGGREASQAIIHYLVAAYYNNAVGADPGARLSHAIQLADQYARPHVPAESATTLVAAVIYNNQLYVANIGDSRLYWLRNDRIQQLTDDHVQQDKLARYLISLPGVRPDMFLLPELNPGDRILLCSDGLYNSLPISDIYQSAQGNVKRAVKKLIKEANRLGGHDNISVVLAAVQEKRLAAVSWQTISIVALLPLLALLLYGTYSGFSELLSDRDAAPTLMATAAVPATPLPPTEIIPIVATAPSGATTIPIPGEPTTTLQPSRTPTPTPSSTPIPPTFTPTFTSTPTQTPSPTYTPSPSAESANTPISETPTPTLPPPPLPGG